MERVRVGVIGAGMMGETHALAYSRIEGVELLAVCDVIPNLAEALAKKVGAKKFFTDYKETLKLPEVDIVDICVPTRFHPELVMAAAEAGKNVFCEKPMALSLREADAMIEATERTGVKFMVGHVLRFWPEYVAAKGVIASGELGAPLSASAVRIGPPPLWSPWFLNPEMSGGAVLDLHIHDLDILNWLFGEPEIVFCQGLRSEKGSWDHVLTTVSYGGGGRGHACASWFMPQSFPFTAELRVVCEEGAVEFSSRAASAKAEELLGAGRTLAVWKEGQPEYPSMPKKDGYFAEIEYFVERVKKDERPTVITPEDARLAVALCLAARRSAEEGRAVRFPP